MLHAGNEKDQAIYYPKHLNPSEHSLWCCCKWGNRDKRVPQGVLSASIPTRCWGPIAIRRIGWKLPKSSRKPWALIHRDPLNGTRHELHRRSRSSPCPVTLQCFFLKSLIWLAFFHRPTWSDAFAICLPLHSWSTPILAPELLSLPIHSFLPSLLVLAGFCPPSLFTLVHNELNLLCLSNGLRLPPLALTLSNSTFPLP